MTPTKVLGILGGMGPLATAYFYEHVVRATPATSDQTHIPTVIWSDTRIPDRTEALLGTGTCPVPAMNAAALALRSAGADVIAVPCNTAHAFLPRVRSDTGACFLDMVRSTVRAARERHPRIQRIGVLSTRGTRLARLYETAAEESGLTVRQVSDDQQTDLVDEAIRIVKRGGRLPLAERLVHEAAQALAAGGAEVTIAACTELPLVASRAATVMPLLDSVRCLAEAAVARFSSAAGPGVAYEESADVSLSRPRAGCGC